MSGQRPLRLLLSVIRRGSGQSMIEYLKSRHIPMHLQFTGHGTASSEMMDILGLGTSDKDVLLSLAEERAMKALARELSGSFDAVDRGQGIAMILSPCAASNLLAAIISRTTGQVPDTEGADYMKSEYDHSLILVAVNQGFTDGVMHAARLAGATGGTVVRARFAGSEAGEQLHRVFLQQEKEILMILAPNSLRGGIMEAVNREFGLSTEAGGIVFALPVDRAFKI